MRRRYVFVILGLLMVGLLWLLWRRPAGTVPPGAVASQAAGGVAPGPDPGAKGVADGGARATSLAATERIRQARAGRDAMRAAILQALAARQQPAATPAVPPPQARGGDAPRPPGNLADRIGGREALARQLNHDFMPLADECIERAQEQTPGLAGMLVIGIETVADKEVGAVVEQAGAAPRNAVDNADLLECIRETALSLRLPPPPDSGREKFEISLRIEPTAGAPQKR